VAGSSDDVAEDTPEEGAGFSTIHTSGIRPRTEPSDSRSRLVVFASRDEVAVSAFEASMPSDVRVLRLDDVFSALDSLRGQDAEEPTLVVDQREGLFRTETVAALSSALPDGARVLLWGSSEEETDEATTLAPGRRFHRADGATSVVDLARMCRPGRSDLPPAPAAPRLLILDDDDAYSRSVARLLRTAGFEVVVEREAKTALDLCRDGDLVAALVDLHMPGMNGSSFASGLRLAMGDDTPKIILVTGDHSTSLDDGLFDAILHKPVGPARLLATLADLIPSTET
jgi:CheY-like chemotaxis protein